MSESKTEYYARHLGGISHMTEEEVSEERRRRDGNVILGPGEQMEMIQPTGLPTLLARMVGEYTKELCLHISSDISGGMALAFNRTLLESAQPALTAYLEQITTPPKFVVREQ